MSFDLPASWQRSSSAPAAAARLILTHDNPDPDSLAAALGLRQLFEAAGLAVDDHHRRHHRPRREPRHGARAEDRRWCRSSSSTGSRTRSSRWSTRSRAPATTRCRRAPRRHRHRPPSAAPRSRRHSLARHPHRHGRDRDHRLRLPRGAAHLASTRCWRPRSSTRSSPRRATSGARAAPTSATPTSSCRKVADFERLYAIQQPQARPRALRRGRSRAALARRCGASCSPINLGALDYPIWSPRWPTSCCRTRRRTGSCASGSTTGPRLSLGAHRHHRRQRRRAHPARGRRATAPPADTA